MPNRALFDDRLRQAVSQARRDQTRLALLFVDLDDFKVINDTFGHHVGDLLLKAAAKRMQACVRNVDTVGRLGGDEFVVLLTHIEVDQDALLVAEKICSALNQPFDLDGRSLTFHPASVWPFIPNMATTRWRFPEAPMPPCTLPRKAEATASGFLSSEQ